VTRISAPARLRGRSVARVLARLRVTLIHPSVISALMSAINMTEEGASRQADRSAQSRRYSMSWRVRGTYPPGDARGLVPRGMQNAFLRSTGGGGGEGGESRTITRKTFWFRWEAFLSFFPHVSARSILSLAFICIKDDRPSHVTFIAGSFMQQQQQQGVLLSLISVRRSRSRGTRCSRATAPSIHRDYRWTVVNRYRSVLFAKLRASHYN